MKKDHIEAVEKYLNALKNRDLSLAPLADNLEFEDPIAGKGGGAENFVAFLTGFLPSINDVRVRRHVCEEEYVVTQFEVDGVFGKIPILEMFRVENGKITQAFGYFDPRPILGS